MSSDNLQRAGSHTAAPRYREYPAMLDAERPDAVFIATPHWFHVDMAIEALRRGIHVLVEKPVGVYGLDVRRAIAAHEEARRSKPDLVFAAMFNMRTEDHWRKIKTAVDGLGRLVRVTWIVTDWFRTQHYYASGGWRAHLEGRGRRGAAEPVPAQPRPAPVARGHARPDHGIRLARQVPPHRGRGRGERLLRVPLGRGRAFHHHHRGESRHQPAGDRRRVRQARVRGRQDRARPQRRVDVEEHRDRHDPDGQGPVPAHRGAVRARRRKPAPRADRELRRRHPRRGGPRGTGRRGAQLDPAGERDPPLVAERKSDRSTCRWTRPDSRGS